MKTLTLLLIITVSPIILFAQQNFYFPKVDCIWNNYEITETGGTVDVNIVRYGLFLDTTINNVDYHKIYVINNDSTLNINKMQYFAAIRENDQRQVFIKHPEENEDILIYDFSLREGDTVISNAQEGYMALDNVVVTKIDTVQLYDGTFRERYQLGSHDYWIEGIGSVSGLMAPISNKPSDPQHSFKLGCMKWMSNVEYLDKIFCDKCFCVKLTAVEKNEAENNLFTFPNPFHDNLQIKINTTGIKSHYSIYTIDGKLMLEGSFNSSTFNINTQNIDYGTYILKVNNDGKVFKQVIIKN